ncbi:hypothetical protein [Cysteiniphilum sp. QT6929]|uniref:hypothetical protein n=1 Tax=Cysteiniphilum sp. QT6929 TaxID=2975055 RepID=UPI0024B37CD4|nr:hypothetical protein [Cysteiniphilum sp. QT6929]WHN66298.1 hypothetical protein NYP54_03450 [Cysteiniphilum sp. QT6929]
MRTIKLCITLGLLSSMSAFASGSHPMTFQNNANDTQLSVNYITGHKYSKCVSYVRPHTLNINPQDAELSIFMDKDSRTCNSANKRASWVLKTADGSSTILTFKHEPVQDGRAYTTYNDIIVVDGNKIAETDILNDFSTDFPVSYNFGSHYRLVFDSFRNVRLVSR